ncbi:MAG: DUF2059 domain-containing protein [Hyphomonadaceae bacterium]
MIPRLVHAIGQAQGLTTTQSALVSRVVREEMIADMPQLLDMMAQLYAMHLSAEDLNAAADFYETEAGRHFIAAQPQLTTEGQAIADAWSRQMLPRVAARIEAESRTPGGSNP